MFGAKPPGNSSSSIFGTPTHQQSGTGTTSGSSNFGFGGAGGTPNTSSLFSTPTTSTQPSSGIFGTAPTGPAAGTGSGFFGGTTPAAATTTSVPSTGGIFGAAPAATSAPTTGGIFGGSNPAAGTTPSAPGSGLFGSIPAPATSTAPSSGLFGQTPASTAPSSGLFGSTPAPTAPSSGLFGSTPAPSTTTSTPGLSFLGGLGSTSAGTQHTTQQKGLFNSTAPTLSLFAPTTTITNTNNQQSNQQALPGGVKVDAYNVAPYHKFHELSDPIRIEIEAAEKYIVSEIQKSESLSAFFPEHRDMVTSVRSDAELMERKLITTNSFLQSDAAALETLVKHQKEDDQHASLSVRTLDLLRLPHATRLIQQQQQASAVAAASGGMPGAGAPAPGSTGQPGFAAEVFGPLPTMSSTSTNESDITSNVAMINYFNRVGSEMEARLQQFSESVGEVEASLRSVEVQAARKLAQRGVMHEVGGNGAQGIDVDQGGRQDDVRRLNRALKEFYEALSDTAVRVVDSKEGLREVKAQVEKRAQGGNIGRSVRR
ncbi:hypothetical protein L211DRAFT_840718 [Terfezia boudieri ATCC MYA-4762]|uniref:Nucleoporin Nup54 alpha-helical domain-containing protein n=1 Tax=Terfezia boudieri ATCC MYA-4762 TaxID=1051890 RepID=A0A3N4LF69_9PEZI|nr:hypothetical protein L211DRAFT_840718 [Terfezia boudieri ATCC MYA-4762]